MSSWTPISSSSRTAHSPDRAPAPTPPARGPVGNQRLTALTGGLLIVGLAVLGIAILRIGSFFDLHMILGALLVGPLILKLGSAGYRLTGYYGGRSSYRRLGPPHPAFRLLAPLVVLSTLVLFGAGGLMLLLGPSSRHTLVPIHKVAFFAWLVFLGLHVLGHLPTLWRVLREEGQGLRARAPRGGPLARVAALGLALLIGAALALLLHPDMLKIQHSRQAEHHELALAKPAASVDEGHSELLSPQRP